MSDSKAEELIVENEKELAGFASGNVTAISPVLERVLEEIRATGVPCYSWAHLKKLLSAKLQVAMDQVAAADTNSSTVGVGWSPTNKNKSSERRATITELLNTFEGRVAVVLLSLLPGVEEGSCKLTRNVLDVLCSPPFTLQRLTEVILEPQKSYKTLNKLLNALEKLLAVSTTIQVVDPRALTSTEESPAAEPTLQAPLVVQVVQGNTELDAVARAPWGTTADDASS